MTLPPAFRGEEGGRGRGASVSTSAMPQSAHAGTRAWRFPLPARTVERLPRKLADRLLVHGLALLLELLLQVEHPAEHLLVREPVQRAREAAHGRGEGEVRVRERRADEARRVRAHVAALVVRVDREVKPHDLVELRRREAEHAREVGRVVE
jgi:hypothetical protein